MIYLRGNLGDSSLYTMWAKKSGSYKQEKNKNLELINSPNKLVRIFLDLKSILKGVHDTKGWLEKFLVSRIKF